MTPRGAHVAPRHVLRDRRERGQRPQDWMHSLLVENRRLAEELRALAHGIYPVLLRDRGIAAALRSHGTQASVPVHVVDQGIGRSSALTEAAIYFCIREAIQNASKHAGPGVAFKATLGRREHSIEFTVSDDGAGMESADDRGMGSTSMRDRIEAVGGRLAIFSAPGRGTHIHGTIPDRDGRTRMTSAPRPRGPWEPRGGWSGLLGEIVFFDPPSPRATVTRGEPYFDADAYCVHVGA